MIDLVSNRTVTLDITTLIVRKFWVWQSSGSSSSKQAELNYGHAWATVPTLIVEENLYLKNQIWS